MKFSASQIASMIGASLEGDGNVEIYTVTDIESGKKGGITFLANPKYTPFIYSTEASAVIVSNDFVPEKPVQSTLLKVSDPYSAFVSLLEAAQAIQQSSLSGIHAQSMVDPDAEIGEDVYIGAFAYVSAGAKISKGCKIHPFAFVGKNVSVGDYSILNPHVCLYDNTQIGKNCILHTGAKVGTDGFGFAPQEDGSLKKIPHLGNVVLEDEVEVGANTTIDRGTMGATRIKKGTKLDNLVQIAHNVEVGSYTVIAAQTGVAGSTKLGKNVMIGGQVGIVGHLNIADYTKIDAQSGVNKSIKKEGQAFRGSPIQLHRDQLKSELMFRKLVSMQNRIEELEKKLSDLNQGN